MLPTDLLDSLSWHTFLYSLRLSVFGMWLHNAYGWFPFYEFANIQSLVTWVLFSHYTIHLLFKFVLGHRFSSVLSRALSLLSFCGEPLHWAARLPHWSVNSFLLAHLYLTQPCFSLLYLSPLVELFAGSFSLSGFDVLWRRWHFWQTEQSLSSNRPAASASPSLSFQ